jgi:hypothetical protein
VGYIDKRNRKSRNIFQYLNPECEYAEMADYVAARNIAAKVLRPRAAVNQPIVAPLFTTVTNLPEYGELLELNRPPILTGGS